MKNIVLIPCVSKKKDYETIAEELYESSLFKFSLSYAKKLNPDKIYILSALYGLVELKDVVKPYDKTLNKMKKKDRIKWSEMVFEQMKERGIDLNNDKFTILAGQVYRENLLEHIANYVIPLEGMRIGEQLSYLKRESGQ